MLGLGLGLKAKFSGLGLGMRGLGLACQRLVNNVLPLKLSSCMSHVAYDCVNKVQVVDCVLCVL